MKYSIFVFVILLFSISMSSCDKESQAEKDELTIQEYLADNNLTTQTTASGLHYIINETGTGEHPDITSTVTVDYRGTLLDGTEFDSSYARGMPSTFGLWQVIQGWQEGIPLLEKGGSGRLIIPSEQAYGSSGAGTIPGNSVLIFDIELHDFE